MPELPEMETYRRHLEAHTAGQRIGAVEVGRERSLNMPAGSFTAALVGATITGVGRAGKMLVVHLDRGQSLLNHLMLGGGIYLGSETDKPDRSFQVILRFADGSALYWFGLRLGWLHLLSAAELAERLADLGVDPLSGDFTPAYLAASLEGRRAALKAMLVDQRYFPGVGNCYADEACWAARIHPLRPAGGLLPAEHEALWQGLRQTLGQSVALGGYTETPFTAGDRLTGGYLVHLAVYDRQGQPCNRCGAPIIKQQAGGRKLFFCPNCQPVQPVQPGHGAVLPAALSVEVPRIFP